MQKLKLLWKEVKGPLLALLVIFALMLLWNTAEQQQLKMLGRTHDISNIVWKEFKHEPRNMFDIYCPKEYLLLMRYKDGWLADFQGPVTTHATCLIPKGSGLPKIEPRMITERSA